CWRAAATASGRRRPTAAPSAWNATPPCGASCSSARRPCRSAAARELERGDARRPVEGAAALQVFGRVPERAVVHRVDRHGAVVAPAREVAAALRAGALDNRGFGLHRT